MMTQDQLNKIGIDDSQITPEVIQQMRDNGLTDLADAMAERLRIKSSACDVVLDSLITQDEEMIEMKNHVRILSGVDDPVLILGPSGTGKEIIARALHGNRKGRFVALNCSSLPTGLAESEMFGHKKGAFTDAKTDRPGLLEEAKDGTIFLDEIGDLDILMQAKLLRAIQPDRNGKRYIRRVGDDVDREISCRIVAATWRDIESWISMERFREDLFYRISTFIIRTKPLMSRKKDVPLIVRHLDKEKRIINVEDFCSGLLANPELLSGNVRALEQMVRRYYVLGVKPGK